MGKRKKSDWTELFGEEELKQGLALAKRGISDFGEWSPYVLGGEFIGEDGESVLTEVDLCTKTYPAVFHCTCPQGQKGEHCAHMAALLYDRKAFEENVSLDPEKETHASLEAVREQTLEEAEESGDLRAAMERIEESLSSETDRDEEWIRGKTLALADLCHKTGYRDRELELRLADFRQHPQDLFYRRRNALEDIRKACERKQWIAVRNDLLEGEKSVLVRCQVYRMEKKTRRLHDLVFSTGFFFVVRQYWTDPCDRYPQEVMEAFEQHIREMAVSAVTQDLYSYIWDCLRIIDSCEGGNERARALALDLADTYPSRKGMVSRMQKYAGYLEEEMKEEAEEASEDDEDDDDDDFWF